MIEQILISVFVIQGIHGTTRKGMALGFVEQFWTNTEQKKSRLSRFISNFLSDPLSECPVCMSSIWGIGLFFIFSAFPFFMIEPWLLPVFLMAIAGINSLIADLFE